MIPNATEAAQDQQPMTVTSVYIGRIVIWTENVYVTIIGQARIVAPLYRILTDAMIDDINALDQLYMIV